jgi:endonuclease/exonuclease/phosphatase family metal-dependent hydrolase
MKILTYNIHKGFTFGNRRFVLEKMREGIRHLRPDLICLQEVSGFHSKHSKKYSNYPLESQFEFLADEIWTHYAYGKNAVYAEGHHGNAILSRYPITKWNNLDISTNCFENRGLLHATIDGPHNKKIHLMSAHLNLIENSRMIQIRMINRYIRKLNIATEALILGGDFNDWGEKISPYLKKKQSLKEAHFEKTQKHARTFPCFFPLLKLDRIYFRNLELKDSWTVNDEAWNKLSDHVALMAEFKT